MKYNTLFDDIDNIIFNIKRREIMNIGVDKKICDILEKSLLEDDRKSLKNALEKFQEDYKKHYPLEFFSEQFHKILESTLYKGNFEFSPSDIRRAAIKITKEYFEGIDEVSNMDLDFKEK